MKILVIQQKMIGDVLISALLLEELKKHYDITEVHYMIYSNTQAVVLKNPFIDKLWLFDAKKKGSLSYLFSKGNQIKREKFDVIIDVYAKIGTALLSFLSKAPQKISYSKKYTKFLYTHVMEKPKVVKTNIGLTIEERLSLLQPLGIESDYSITPKIFITEEEKKQGIKLFQDSGLDITKKTFMMSIIGSSASKTYPLEYMSKIIDCVVETLDCNILFNYIPHQIEDAKKVYDSCSEETRKHINFELYGKSLREFIVMMSCCDGIIGNDGGAINIAKSLDKPSFIIFSPWINKKSWSTYEDGKYHTSVHLEDYQTDLWDKYPRKEIKENANEFYNRFKANLFKDKLISFLEFIKQEDLSTYQLSDSVQVY